MARNILLILGNGLGSNLGPNFNLTTNVGSVTPSTATRTQLLAGLIVSVDDIATQVTVTSTGPCSNSITQTIPCVSTTTSTTSTTTSTTTAPPIVIDENTLIIIWFDNSGSMNSTLAPLQTMRNTILRDCLVQFYGGNYALYDQNVTVKNFDDVTKPGGSERTLFVLNTTGSLPTTTKVINLVFQDESSPYNAVTSPFSTSGRTAQYDIDLAAFRTTLNNVPNNDYYRGVVFRVNTGPNSYDGFRQFLVAIRDGSGAYSGTNGLSDKSEIAYVEYVDAASTPQYYADQIITALNTLGYNLTLCSSLTTTTTSTTTTSTTTTTTTPPL
jgi:hypothetical protein